MSKDYSYTVPQDVLVAHLQGEAVLLNMETKRYYRLNAPAASIWRGLEQRERVAGIVSLLCEEFDVSSEEARQETERVMEDLLERGLLARTPQSPTIH